MKTKTNNKNKRKKRKVKNNSKIKIKSPISQSLKMTTKTSKEFVRFENMTKKYKNIPAVRANSKSSAIRSTQKSKISPLL